MSDDPMRDDPKRLARKLESARQRRQLTPIPSGWEEMREDELEDLLGASPLLPRA
jgi:hypothetical protein